MALKEHHQITEKMGVGIPKPITIQAAELKEHLSSAGVQRRLARVRALARARAQQKS